MEHFKPLSFILLISLWSIILPVSSQVQPGYEELDKTIAHGVELFNMPGMAVGIIKNGEVVFSKAYGYSNSETKEPANTETLFGIASCSKAFTAACIAILVDEGKLKWEDRVIDHYPEFKMYDPYITREMRIQDLLCHRSGLQTFDGDLLWYGTHYTRAEVVNRIQYRENEYSFRSHFGYQNVMFIAAGEVIKAVTGKTWDEFVKEHIFNSLGMERTTTTNAGFANKENVAWPHQDGKPMDFINYDNSGPAASINTSVDDLLRWVDLMLNKGTYNDQEILSANAYYKLVSPMTMLNAGKAETPEGTHFYGYGLGWFLYDKEGMKVIQHGGGLPGFHSKVVLVPEDSLGFVIIANELSGMVEATYQTILDYHISKSGRDFIQDYYDGGQKQNAMKTEKEAEKEAALVAGTNPSLELSEYTGTYTDKMYGDAEVVMEGKNLRVTFLPTKRLFTGTLEHWHFDTFKVQFNDPFLPAGYITFEMNGNGKVIGFKIDLENPDFHFFKLDFVKQ